MKTRLFKPILTLTLIVALAFSLAGCDNLDYREAVQLYNAGLYEQAAQLFAEIPEYEDSAQLETRCYYRLALNTMAAEDYESALEQFEALGNYEDAPARVTECKYQLGLSAFDAGDLVTAEGYFADNPDYQQTPEYCRRITWQKLFDAIAEKAPGEVDSILETEADGRTVQVIARNADIQELVFSVSSVKDMGYVFNDSLSLRFTRDSLQATFTAESGFQMAFNGSVIGSRQTGSGTLDIAACTAETALVLESFGLTVTDNQGQSTTSTDPADCLMNEAMVENLAILLDTVPEILTQAEIPFTLTDIGFASL